MRKIEHIDKINKDIGAKIAKLRLELGLSRQKLSEQIEVTHQQLQKYEKGTNRVSAGRLAIIAKSLEKPISYFFEDIEDLITEEIMNKKDLKHQQECIELSCNFMKIKKFAHKEAVNSFIKTLSNVEQIQKENEQKK